MARLYRPSIPLAVRVKVAERQFFALPMSEAPYEAYTALMESIQRGKGLALRLAFLLAVLAKAYGCTTKDLRLDHNPALALRPQRRKGLGRKIYYVPDANDPAHLEYRSHAGHDTKTRVRGDRGQFSDLALIRREKRRKQRALLERASGKPISLLSAAASGQRKFKSPLKRKAKIAARPNAWPKGRKIRSKGF